MRLLYMSRKIEKTFRPPKLNIRYHFLFARQFKIIVLFLKQVILYLQTQLGIYGFLQMPPTYCSFYCYYFLAQVQLAKKQKQKMQIYCCEKDMISRCSYIRFQIQFLKTKICYISIVLFRIREYLVSNYITVNRHSNSFSFFVVTVQFGQVGLTRPIILNETFELGKRLFHFKVIQIKGK